jgi:hypothetical protein
MSPESYPGSLQGSPFTSRGSPTRSLPSSGVPHRSDDPKTCDSSGDTAKVNVEKLDKKLKKIENKLAATRYPQKKRQSRRP